MAVPCFASQGKSRYIIMKILLVYPPVTFSNNSYLPSIYLPLGILYVAAGVEIQGNDVVEIYDARLSAKINADTRFFTLGDHWKEIERRIYKAKPDLVGISTLSFAQMRNVDKVAEIVKKIEKDTLVVVGGQHPSVYPEDFLVNTNIDIVIKGEGEEVFPQLLQRIRARESIEGIPGVVSKSNFNTPQKPLDQKYIFNLDDLPFPAYHLYDMGRYLYLQNHGFSSRFRRHGRRPVSMITSRGCPFNCTFCLGYGVMGKQWRSHSVDYIMKHIDFLIREFDIDLIHFEDDNINFDYKRFEGLLYNLKNLKHRLSWDTPNGLRADKLDKTILIQAKESSCGYLILGVESGDQRILNEIIKKNLNLSIVMKVAKLCKDLNLKLFAFFVIGFPGEKIADMKKTISFALDLFWQHNVIPAIFWAAPYKGTELYDLCKEGGYFTEPISPDSFINDHQLNGKMLIETRDFSPKDIRKLLCEYRKKMKLLIFIKSIFSPALAIEYLSVLLKNLFLIRDYFKGHKNAYTSY